MHGSSSVLFGSIAPICLSFDKLESGLQKLLSLAPPPCTASVPTARALGPDRGKMDFNRLQYFVVVAEELNLHRAATRLGITQPAITAQIATLEEEIGLDLLIRDRQRIVGLTAAGQSFLREAKRSLAELERVRQSAQAIAEGKQGVFRLGLCEEISSPHLLRLFRTCREALPDHLFQFTEFAADEMLDAVLREEIDIAFSYLPLLDAGVSGFSVWQEPWLAVIPDDHPLANAPRVTCHDLQDTDLLLTSGGQESPINELIRGNFRAMGLKPRIAMEVARRSTLLTLAAAGLGVTFLPGSFVELDFAHLRLVPLEGRGIETWCSYLTAQKLAVDACLRVVCDHQDQQVAAG